MEYVLVTTMVIGVVELIKRLQAKDFYTAIIILVAALVGGLCGYFGLEGLNIATGIVVGLAGSGIITVANKI